MIIKRTQNAKNGIIWGLISKMIMLLFPFFVQRIMIHSLGVDYAGVKGLFSSVLEVLNLAELGIGTAIVYCMYKPIAEDDTEEICALLAVYRKIYFFIGLVVLLIGICFIPFLDALTKSKYPDGLDIRIIYIMYIANSVASYWVFAYRTSLLVAYQRNDILSKISIVVSFFNYSFQIFFLLIMKNYYLYLSIMILSTIVNNTLVYYITLKKFPEIECRGKASAEILNEIIYKIQGLFVYKLVGITRNSIDSIVVSMFLGLSLTTIYNNYYFVILSLSNLLGVITVSLLAGIGNSMKIDSVEKNRSDMEKLDCIYMLISGLCTVCLTCLYQDFMKLWVGTELTLPFPTVVIFCCYFYLLKMGDVRALYVDACGLWRENRLRIVIESVCNIFLNLIFVKMWGIAGIIGATVITVFLFGFVWAAYILYYYYFKEGLFRYFINQTVYAVATIIVCAVTYMICSFEIGNIFVSIVLKGLICLFVAPLCYFVLLHRKQTVRISISWVIEKIKH